MCCQACCFVIGCPENAKLQRGTGPRLNIVSGTAEGNAAARNVFVMNALLRPDASAVKVCQTCVLSANKIQQGTGRHRELAVPDQSSLARMEYILSRVVVLMPVEVFVSVVLRLQRFTNGDGSRKQHLASCASRATSSPSDRPVHADPELVLSWRAWLDAARSPEDRQTSAFWTCAAELRAVLLEPSALASACRGRVSAGRT
jgi:hypothetical protein